MWAAGEEFMRRVESMERMVPAPEYDAALNIKIIHFLRHHNLHSLQFILPPLVLNKFIITGANKKILALVSSSRIVC